MVYYVDTGKCANKNSFLRYKLKILILDSRKCHGHSGIVMKPSVNIHLTHHLDPHAEATLMVCT